MQDQGQQYPLKQPRRHPFDDLRDDEDEQEPFIQPVEPPRPRQRAVIHQHEAPEQPELPRGRLKITLLIALVAGIIASLINIVVTLVNAGLYNKAAESQYVAHPTAMPIGIATQIFILFLLTSVISGVIYFIAGFVTGKIAVSRRMGFLCGFVAGAITQVIGYVVQHFPNYPGTVSSGTTVGLPGITGGTLVALILVVVVGLITGLVSFLGSWLATRRHPFYVS